MRQGTCKASGLGPSGPQEQSNMECPSGQRAPPRVVPSEFSPLVPPWDLLLPGPSQS